MVSLEDEISQIVSRETISNLRRYEKLLLKVNETINLVSRKDIHNLWYRHIVDSVLGYKALIFSCGKEKVMSIKLFLDIGSGGGFPGIPFSMLLNQARGTLIESIKKKASALIFFKKDLSLNIHIENKRVEEDKHCGFDLLTSRAVCRLEKLLDYSYKKISQEGVCLFWKGRTYKEEIEEASRKWNFDVDVVSVKDILSNVDENDQRVWLVIKNIRRK